MTERRRGERRGWREERRQMGGGEREDTRGWKKEEGQEREQRKKKGEGERCEINEGWARGGGKGGVHVMLCHMHN